MNFRPRDWAGNPGYRDEGYKSTALRGPTRPLVKLPQGMGEATGPAFSREWIAPLGSDLTRNARINGEPLGERIIVTGRVLDENARPVANAIIELWQANAAGRYAHRIDQHDAPLDPNFLGAGHAATDAEGRYRFLTIKPGAYPWRNHHNAWRPNHLHFSLFGAGLASRLVTQMYFPGDPLLPFDPIYMSVPAQARERLVSRFDLETTEPEFALAFIFDIVLRGRGGNAVRDMTLPNLLAQTPSQTVGPFFALGLTARQYGYPFAQIADGRIARDDTPGKRIRIVGQVIDGAGEAIPDAMIEIWQADASGRYAGPREFADPCAFHGFGRVGTGSDAASRFIIDTIKPGSSGAEAPHLNLVVFMRGLLLHAYTRIYFSDEADANSRCPVLACVPPERRGTLIAECVPTHYVFDIHMQGARETAFFDL